MIRLRNTFFILFLFANLINLWSQGNDELILQGQVRDINGELIDSLFLEITSENETAEFLIRNGEIQIPIKKNTGLLQVVLQKKGYRNFETSINTFEGFGRLNIRMYPNYNILLKGRVRAGNVPVEGVNVLIKHNDKVFTQKTLGCYLDTEDYWNCLFLGMFKADIMSDQPNDSITLYFTKQGYKPHTEKILFSEYAGNILDIKLQYADKIPELPSNNVNLKVSPPSKVFYPFADYEGWYISASYYNHPFERLSRLSAGFEANMISTEYNTRSEIFDNTDSTQFDSTFIDISLGPSVVFWIIKPEVRKFGTYIGNSLQYSLSTKEFNYQPFIGTRYFLDLNKALSLELRYINHTIEKVTYEPNAMDDARRVPTTESEQKWLINIGIQVTF